MGHLNMRSIPVILLLAVGCGSVAPRVQMSEAVRLTPTTLYPMNEGAQWVYDVDTGGDEPPTLGIFEVTEVRGDQRSIQVNLGMDSEGTVTYGDATVYEVTDEGVRHVASNGWLLRAPLREGAEWEGLGGRTARVADLDVAVEVMAGNFEHCVAIEESGGEDGRVVRTTYCPEVGPVMVESTLEAQLTLRTVSATSRLRAYDPGGGDDE
jgi:hypothetical protein